GGARHRGGSARAGADRASRGRDRERDPTRARRWRHPGRAQARHHGRRGPARILHGDGRGTGARVRPGRDDLATGGRAGLRQSPPLGDGGPGPVGGPSLPGSGALRAGCPGAAEAVKRALATLALLLVTGVAYAAAPPPAVTRRVLASGMTVIVRQDASVGVMAASLHVRAGSLFETADTVGITNFLHRVMLRGTSRYNALQLTEAIEDLGGSLDAFGDVEYGEVRGTALARSWEGLLKLMAEVALRPTLPDEEIERERRL